MKFKSCGILFGEIAVLLLAFAAKPSIAADSAQSGDGVAPHRRYLVVDVSSGPDAASYPVDWLDEVPAEGWTDEYRTTKIVLRLVEPGTFTTTVQGAKRPCKVTLSKPFYLGVFEVTQRQWELVRGAWQFAFTNTAFAATRPADTIRYHDVRGQYVGTAWPVSRIVDADSFLGRLRLRSGMMGFDLPTCAQWEYACTAGGNDPCDNLVGMARHRLEGQPSPPQPSKRHPSGVGKDEGTAPVGSYHPNAWGFYDMFGNVAEWVRDHVDNSAVVSEGEIIDPPGPISGRQELRFLYRGGGYREAAYFCKYNDRKGGSMGHEFGFRLCCELPPDAFTNAPSMSP